MPQISTSRKIILFLLILVLLIGASVGMVYTTGKIAAINALFATATARAHKAAIDTYNQAAATNGIMFGFNAQHTHANPYENILSPTTVSALTKKWVFQTGNFISSSPAVVNGIVYVGSFDGNLYAIDAISGTKEWTYKIGSIDSSPAVVNGVVYVGSDDHNLYAFYLPNAPENQ